MFLPIQRSNAPSTHDVAFKVGSITNTITAAVVVDRLERMGLQRIHRITGLLPTSATVPTCHNRQITIGDILPTAQACRQSCSNGSAGSLTMTALTGSLTICSVHWPDHD
jgi:hypothetical protein